MIQMIEIQQSDDMTDESDGLSVILFILSIRYLTK